MFIWQGHGLRYKIQLPWWCCKGATKGPTKYKWDNSNMRVKWKPEFISRFCHLACFMYEILEYPYNNCTCALSTGFVKQQTWHLKKLWKKDFKLEIISIIITTITTATFLLTLQIFTLSFSASAVSLVLRPVSLYFSFRFSSIYISTMWRYQSNN